MKTMILSAIVAFAFQANASEVSYSNQVVLPTSASQFKLVSAQYDLIPTKTETRYKPGCRPNSESGETCEETVVLESQPVIRVDVSYQDSMFSSENEPQWASVNFKTDDFSAADVAALKAIYPAWKHPFTRLASKYAQANFKIAVTKTSNTIRLVDMKRSKLCAVNGESGEKFNPNCEDQIVYKNAQSPALLLTVSRK